MMMYKIEFTPRYVMVTHRRQESGRSSFRFLRLFPWLVQDEARRNSQQQLSQQPSEQPTSQSELARSNAQRKRGNTIRPKGM